MAIQLIQPKRPAPAVIIQRSVGQQPPPRSEYHEAYDRSQIVPRRNPVARNMPVMRALTLSTNASPFGCCNFFDRCNDEIMTLHYSGTLGLLDWMGFNVSNECLKVVEFIAYQRPAQSGGNPTAGYLSNACADPNGIDYGTAKITLEDFGRYGRITPTRDIMKPKRYCATDPVYRLDGAVVTNENEWDMRFATDVMLQDVSKDIVVGNPGTAGQMPGLEYWVKTGYPGPNGKMLNSIVIDWNGNDFNGNGGGAKTWNGAAIMSGFDLIDVLLDGFRKIKQRISWARQLANQPMQLGDMVVALPTFMSHCLLDAYACWSVCGGSQYSPVNLQQSEVRSFRNNLISASNPANLFGAGYITLDNVTIPLMNWDWGLIKGPGRGDMYLLTGGIGSTRIWEGEHLDANTAAQEYSDEGYESFDGGRILGTTVVENECRVKKFWMHPRTFCRAPWAQIRFMDVECDAPGGVLSPDPSESSFFPQAGSFTSATC